MLGNLFKRATKVTPKEKPRTIEPEDLDFDFVPMCEIAIDAVDYMADAFNKAEFAGSVLITLANGKAVLSFGSENTMYVREENGFWISLPKVSREKESSNESSN